MCVKCKQWRIYWVNQCNMPSDSHNILQIHHRLFTSMNKLCPSIATPTCSLGGGEFLFIYFGKPFMQPSVPSILGLTMSHKHHAIRIAFVSPPIPTLHDVHLNVSRVAYPYYCYNYRLYPTKDAFSKSCDGTVSAPGFHFGG